MSKNIHSDYSNKILVVDDEELFLELTEEFFAEAGINIVTTTNPDAVVSLFQQHDLDILITDLNLPNCNGIDLAFKIKQLYPDTKIVFMTGYNELADNEEKLMRHLGSKILHKPFPIDSLISTIGLL